MQPLSLENLKLTNVNSDCEHFSWTELFEWSFAPLVHWIHKWSRCNESLTECWTWIFWIQLPLLCILLHYGNHSEEICVPLCLCCMDSYIHSSRNFRLMKTFSWLGFISRPLTLLLTTKCFTLSWTVMWISSTNPKLSMQHCGVLQKCTERPHFWLLSGSTCFIAFMKKQNEHTSSQLQYTKLHTCTLWRSPTEVFRRASSALCPLFLPLQRLHVGVLCL